MLMKNILLKKVCFKSEFNFSGIFNVPPYLFNFQLQISELISQPSHFLSSEKYHKPFMHMYLTLKEKNEGNLYSNRVFSGMKEMKESKHNPKLKKSENLNPSGFLTKNIKNPSQIKPQFASIKQHEKEIANNKRVFVEKRKENEMKIGKEEQEEEEEEEEERESSYLQKDEITEMDNAKILDAFRSLLKLHVKNLNKINSEVRGIISSISLFENAWKDKEIRENADLITRTLLKEPSNIENPFLIMSLVNAYVIKAHLIKEVEEEKEDLLLLIMNNLLMKGNLYPLDFLINTLIKLETYKLTHIPKEPIFGLINNIIQLKIECNRHLVISIFRLNNLSRLSPDLARIFNVLKGKNSSMQSNPSESPLLSLPSSLLSILFRSHLLGKNQIFTQKEERKVKNKLKSEGGLIGFRRMVLLYGALVKNEAHPDLEDWIKGEIRQTLLLNKQNDKSEQQSSSNLKNDSNLTSKQNKYNPKSLKSLLEIALNEHDKRKKMDINILIEVNKVIVTERLSDWNLVVSLIQNNNRISEILVGNDRDKFMDVYKEIYKKILDFYQIKIGRLSEKNGFPFFYASKLTGNNQYHWVDEFEKKALSSNDLFVVIDYHRASLFLLLSTRLSFEQQIFCCFPRFPSYEVLSYLLEHVVQNRNLIKNWDMYDLIRKRVFENRQQYGWVKLTNLLSRGWEIFTFYQNHEIEKISKECLEWLRSEGCTFPQTIRHLIRFFKNQGQLEFFKNLEGFIIKNPDYFPLQLGWYIFSNFASFRIHNEQLVQIFRKKVENHLINIDCFTCMHILNSFLLINYQDRNFVKYLFNHIENMLINEAKLNHIKKIISLAKLCILTIDLEYSETKEDKKFWSGLNALRNLAEKTEERLKPRIFSSIFHENVGNYLKKMGLRFKEEFYIGPFSIDFLIEFDDKKETKGFNITKKKQVCLEINGYQHYVINNELDKNTERKLKLLKKMGFDIISISQKEWIESEGKKRETAFLFEKLKDYIDFKEIKK